MAFVSNPESRARQSERLRALFADPEVRKRTHAGASARLKRINSDPTFIKLRTAKHAIAAWCPPEYHEDYLKRRPVVGAVQAKAEIMARPRTQPPVNDLGRWKTPRYWPLGNIRIGER